jgi:hypothetical protein
MPDLSCDIALCYCEMALLGVPRSGAIVFADQNPGVIPADS